MAVKKKKLKSVKTVKKLKDLVIDEKYIRRKYDLETYRQVLRRRDYITMDYSEVNSWYDGDGGYAEYSLADALATICNSVLERIKSRGLDPEKVYARYDAYDFRIGVIPKIYFYKETPESDDVVINRLIKKEKAFLKALKERGITGTASGSLRKTSAGKRASARTNQST